MEKISDVIDSKTFLERRQEQEIKKDLDPSSVAVVNRLFVFFETICRGFEKQYQGNQKKIDNEKSQWTRAFMDSGINRIEQISMGVKRCRLESPINTPTIGQFLKWCKTSEEDYDLLPKEIAYIKAYDLLRNGELQGLSTEQFSVIHHALEQSDRYFMKTNSREKTQLVFYRNYEIAIRDFLSGKLKPIHRAIEDKRDEQSEKEKQNYIAKYYQHCKSNDHFRTQMQLILGDSLKWHS
ncbi:replication protein P [Legionella micdadei]|uniref:Phage replication P family protein n=1 Tax=Legionella micdadei TaxID=451 RepID=A0A098GEN3_LEGMI|nr:replication protein P [Legionella micdadei]KTD27573.1 Replication protein P [Legionella micdadei]CEG60938.1 phage replication P family protein [Legionella micdadei]SCY69218.1 phage replication protein P [Legionella micdadei]